MYCSQKQLDGVEPIEIGKTYANANRYFRVYPNPLDLFADSDINLWETLYEVEPGTDVHLRGNHIYETASVKVLARASFAQMLQDAREYTLSNSCSEVYNDVDWQVAVNLDNGGSTKNTAHQGGVAVCTGNDVIAESNCFTDGVAVATGDRSMSCGKGNNAIAVSHGKRSVAIGAGSCNFAIVTGSHSMASTSDTWGMAVSTGLGSIATTSAEYGISVCAGGGELAQSSGNAGIALNAALAGKASVDNKHGIAIATGFASKAKGIRGSWLILVERDGATYRVLDVQAVQVDGQNIKENTYYILKNGVVQEVE